MTEKRLAELEKLCNAPEDRVTHSQFYFLCQKADALGEALAEILRLRKLLDEATKR